ncbi:MAG: PIN/TRAM domain-containing protein [Endomicrobiia bacterium]
MGIWIIRALVVIAGPIIGYLQISNNFKGILIGLAITVCIVLLELLIGSIPLDTLVAAGIGIVLGFIVGNLLEYGVFSLGNDRLSEIMGRYSLLLKFVLVFLGLLLAVRKKEEIDLLEKDILKAGSKKRFEQFKILDTSVIIDGRIIDIVETKFLIGPIVIPQFVLTELQKLADSADNSKRVRARRGLEILHKLQNETDIIVKIYDKDYPEWKDVDTKIIQLAKDIDGIVLTTDFNLNKIASLQGVTVLNVNDLANALKPIYLPGETMSVYVVKEGKERDQGVGYLDDGTMVVVEDGRRFIGRKIDVVVTSTLQTSAGRMIFTRSR